MSNIVIFIILGIVQGLTEALPISSSGHLVIFQDLLNINIPGISFEAFINFGSTITIIYFFRQYIIDLIKGFFGYLKSGGKTYKTEWKFLMNVIVATLPLVFAGIIMLVLDISPEEGIKNVAAALYITAILLFIVNSRRGTVKLDEITYKQALIIGCFQVIALIPGLSRSGMTLVAALLVGIESKAAFDFSFLMFIPASVGALIFSLIDIATDPNLSTFIGGYVLSFIMAVIFTWFGLLITKKFTVAHKLQYFSLYCLIVATSIFIFA